MTQTTTTTTEKFSVDQDIQYRQKAIMLTRAQSRVKQVEFELAVMKEVADARSEQVKELEKVLKQKDIDFEQQHQQQQQQLEEQRAAAAAGNVALDRSLGSHGLQSLLAMSQKKLREQEQQSEWNLDQVLELKTQLESTQRKVEELQQDRTIHVAKIEECITLLQIHTRDTPNGATEQQHELHLRALRAVEYEKKMEAYKKLLNSSEQDVEKLQHQRTINQAMVQELTKILSPELDATAVDDIIGSLKKGHALEPEQAQLLTIQHLKSQVETLEEEKTRFLETITALNQKIMDADEASTSCCGSPSSSAVVARVETTTTTPRKLTTLLRNMRKPSSSSEQQLPSPSPPPQAPQHPLQLENHKMF